MENIKTQLKNKTKWVLHLQWLLSVMSGVSNIVALEKKDSEIFITGILDFQTKIIYTGTHYFLQETDIQFFHGRL